jgi:hypothetical protein
MTFLKKAVLATTAAATALTMSAPAEARTHYRHYRHHNDTAAIAIGAGILGLAIGAAASSGRNGYYNGGYYDGYYNRPGYSCYYDGWFYDGRGYRMYDRHAWDRRWGGRHHHYYRR